MIAANAVKIKERVRDFFDKGYKSGKKIYDLSACLDLAKAKKRNKNAAKSVAHRPAGATSYYNLAELVIKMPVTDRSGNCGEMAALSAYYALKTEFIKRERIFIGSVTNPGDHAFCLVSQAEITKTLTFASVTEFTKSKAAPSWMIIDPWLNVAGPASTYITEGGKKLDKWTAEGKRVAWHAGSKGPNWYAPNGEYKTAFISAPVQLSPF